MPVISSNSPNNGDSFLRSMSSSAVGGYLGGYVCFPFEGIKKRVQRGELHSADFFHLSNGKLFAAIHPKELLRGSTAFATSVTVASASSMTFNSVLKKMPFYDSTSSKSNMLAAISSGMLGALVGSTPVENTILVQQERRIAPAQAMRYMLNQGITRPWVGARELMMREAGFAGVMLYAGPVANKAVLEKTDSHALAALAEIGAGIGGAILTHPADTLATWRQKKEGQISLVKGVEELYALDGAKTFFRGVGSRLFLFTGCAMVIPRAAKFVNDQI